MLQLHVQSGSGSSCGATGSLELSSGDLRDIFIASTAELPGLLAAALIMDSLGRKWCASLPGTALSTELFCAAPWCYSQCDKVYVAH